MKKHTLILITAVMALCFTGNTALAARTDSKWNERGGTYLETIWAEGRDILVNGFNHYVNFGIITGSSGYGFRDSSGTIQWKNSGGSWQDVGTGGGSGGGIATGTPWTAGFLTQIVDDGTIKGIATSSLFAKSLTQPFTHTVVVDQGGKGDCITIKECVDYVATQSPSTSNRWQILVMNGLYLENPFTIPAWTTINGFIPTTLGNFEAVTINMTTTLTSGTGIDMTNTSNMANIAVVWSDFTGAQTGDIDLILARGNNKLTGMYIQGFTVDAAVFTALKITSGTFYSANLTVEVGNFTGAAGAARGIYETGGNFSGVYDKSKIRTYYTDQWGYEKDTTAGSSELANCGFEGPSSVKRTGTGTVTLRNTATISTSGTIIYPNDVGVLDEAYGAGWNGSNNAPTKNALYDKIETLSGSNWGVNGTELYPLLGYSIEVPFLQATSTASASTFAGPVHITGASTSPQFIVTKNASQTGDIVQVASSTSEIARIDNNGAYLSQISVSDQAVALGRFHSRTGALIGPSTTQDIIIGPYVGANDIETESGSTFRMGIGGTTSWVLGGSGGTGLYNHGFGDNVSPTTARMVVRGKTNDSTDNIFDGQNGSSTSMFKIRNDGLVTMAGDAVVGGGDLTITGLADGCLESATGLVTSTGSPCGSGGGGSGIATSGPIADTEIIFGTGVGTVDSEATFTYDDSTDLLTAANASTTVFSAVTGFFTNLFAFDASPSANEVLLNVGTGADASRFSVDEDGDVANDGTITSAGSITASAGNVQGLQIFSNFAGTVTNPNFSFAADTNTGVYKDGAGDINRVGVTTNGINAMLIDENQHVGIGTSTPLGLFTVVSSSSTIPGIYSVGNYTVTNPYEYTFVNENTSVGNLGAFYSSYHNSASPAVGDGIGGFDNWGNNASGTAQLFGYMNTFIQDPTTGSEDGDIVMGVFSAGGLVNRLSLAGDGISLYEDTIIDNDGTPPAPPANQLTIGDGTDTGFVEIEDGELCVGSGGCTSASGDGTLQVETGIVIDDDGTFAAPTVASFFMGDGSDSGTFEVEDAPGCFGDGGCTVGSTDGSLIVESGLVVGTTAAPGVPGTTNGAFISTADNGIALDLRVATTSANVTTADTYIQFTSTSGTEGSIAGTAVAGTIAYNTFTGSHYTRIEDMSTMFVGALLLSTGEPMDEEQYIHLPKSELSCERASQRAYGVYGGDNREGFQTVLGVGAGMMWVSNTGEDLEAGDLLMSSDVCGFAELQKRPFLWLFEREDDVQRNITVGKVQENVEWKDGEEGRFIGVTYLAG